MVSNMCKRGIEISNQLNGSHELINLDFKGMIQLDCKKYSSGLEFERTNII